MIEQDEGDDALTMGAAIIFFAIVGPVVLPIWLLGKLGIFITKLISPERPQS